MPIPYDDQYILRPGHKIEYTKEILNELHKCTLNIEYFAEKYFTIQHPTKGKMLIPLFEYQKEMINNFKNNRFNIVLSARQSGKTTCSCIYLLWYAIFNPDKTIAILANKQATAQGIVADIKIAYELLPPWMKPGVKKYDALRIIFDNGITIYAAATSKDALRGDSASLIFLDEFAFVPENIAEDFWKSNLPTISTGGNVIIVSTPNGSAGLFYNLWKRATSGHTDEAGNKWQNIRIRWDQHPERDEKWKADMLETLGKVGFAQEFECSFTGSSFTLIDGDILESLKSTEPPFYPGEGYYMWKRPEPNRVYAIGADVAKGANSDFHVANIFDVTDYHRTKRYEQVAIFRRNDISVWEFKDKLIELGKQWNDAVIIVENNHLGHAVVQNLYFEDGYENTFFDHKKGEYGINANVKTKPIALSHFKEDIESGKMVIHSNDMIDELGYFEEIRSGVFQARKGRNFHDDTVASGYWVSFLLRSPYWIDYYEWWLKNHNDEYQKLTEYQENNDIQKDLDVASGFLNAIGPNGGEDEADRFRKELSI